MNELNFDKFVSRIHEVFDNLPDYRLPSPNSTYSIKDAALGAFAMFFSQSPSFLSYQQAMQQAQGRNNAQSLFGIENIPSDNQIRNLLDPISPELLYPLFSGALEELESYGHLDATVFSKTIFWYLLMKQNTSVPPKFIVITVQSANIRMVKLLTLIKSLLL